MRMGTDLEELMVMEAIRLSLMEQDERERREAEQRERSERSQDENTNSIPSEDSTSGTGTITTSNEEGTEDVSLDENQQGSDIRNSNSDNAQPIDAHLSREAPIYHEDEEGDGISSTSHSPRSHDNTSTTISTPITSSTEGGTITSTSVPSSSTGSPSPSTTDSANSTINPTANSTTNSTSELLFDPSSPSSFFQNNNTSTLPEITEAAEGSNGQENPSPDITHTDNGLLTSDEQGQTSGNTSNIKKPSVIILPSTSLVEGDDDTRNARGGNSQNI